MITGKTDEYKRILIVEDHEVLRDAIADLVRDLFPEILVFQAGDGKEGIETAARERPDLVLMDIDLPVVNGLSAIKAIREAGIQSRFVVLTIHADTIYKRLAFQAGASAFIHKNHMIQALPFTLRVMLENEDPEDQ